jgi:hypothetical protein
MINFMSTYKILEQDQTQKKDWSITYETGTGSYSYQTIYFESDDLQEILKCWKDDFNGDTIRHISGLFFKVRKVKDKYELILGQE